MRAIRANLGPQLRQFSIMLRQSRADINSVRMKVCVSTSKLTTPQNAVVSPRDSKSFFDCAKKSANVLVETAHLFRSRHLTDVPSRDIQLRHARTMIPRPML